MKRWYQEPFRIFQTNIREIDAVMDVERVVDDLQAFHANAWLLNTGGIVSFYPTMLPYQTPSPWLAERASGDLLGDALKAAHQRGVRVISRFDWSKLPRRLYEQHPEWFFVSPERQPQEYNELYSACPSGAYNQELSFQVMAEVLEHYEIDGVFFNMFGFAPRDYSGKYHGVCQCANCQQRFLQRYGLPLPAIEDWENPAWIDYLAFTRDTASELSGRMRDFIHDKRPDVGLVLFMHAGKGDVIMHEVNHAINRPVWAPATGEKIKLSQGEYPGVPVTINSVLFLDIPYRFTNDQPGSIGLRLAQMLAHGANPYVYVIGTTQQADRRNHAIVRRWYDYAERNADSCTDLFSPARVALIQPERSERLHQHGKNQDAVTSAFRGFYRALSETHLPFDIFSEQSLPDKAKNGQLNQYELLILPNAACLSEEEGLALDAFVRSGGRLIATFESGCFNERDQRRGLPLLECLGVREVSECKSDMRSALLTIGPVEREYLEDLGDTDILPLLGEYLVVQPRAGSQTGLNLIAPGRYGPPEKCYGAEPTDQAGIIWQPYGAGQTAYLPWQPDRYFYAQALPEYRTLMGGLARAMIHNPLVIATNAGPQVELVLRDQPNKNGVRRMVSFINYSGQNGRSFNEPVEMQQIFAQIAWNSQPVHRVHATVLDIDLPFEIDEASIRFTLPRLNLFEKVIIE
jgi:hypothetical protein